MSEVFSEKIIDHNGESVSDINAGLKKYYPLVWDSVTHNAEKVTPIIVDNIKEANPDLIAHKMYDDMSMWFFFLLSNFIDDPFSEIVVNYIYYIYNAALLDEIESNATSSEIGSNRIGTTITLN